MMLSLSSKETDLLDALHSHFFATNLSYLLNLSGQNL